MLTSSPQPYNPVKGSSFSGKASRKHLLDGQGEVPRSALALSDQEGPVMPLFAEHFFCLGSGDFAKKTRMWFHFYVILGDEAIFPIEVCLIPVLVTFFIQNLKDVPPF